MYGFTDKPIRMVIGYPEGSSQHVIFRKIHENIPNQLTTIIESRPGVSGALAQQYVSNQTSDGRTLLYTNQSIIINPIVNKSWTFDAVGSFDAIFYVGHYPNALIGDINSEVNIDRIMKLDGSKVTYSYNGEGSLTYVGLKEIMPKGSVGVAYKGTLQMMPDLMSGRINYTLVPLPYAMTLLDNTKVKIIATTGKTRFSGLLVPTISETIPNFELIIWQGIVAPKGVGKDIIKYLHDYFKSGINEGFVASMHRSGTTIIDRNFSKVIVDDKLKWERKLRD